MIGKYKKPSELLDEQKRTGKSYWDLIGRPLYEQPESDSQPANEQSKYALALQLREALSDYDYPQYNGGKSKSYKPNKSQKNTIHKVYKYLKSQGFDDNSIAGILGNAIQESAINPNLSSAKNTFHGMLMNSSALRDNIASLYGDHSLDSQLQYVVDWTNNSKKIRTKRYAPYLATGAGKYKKTGYKSASEAADAFMKLYERPVILDKSGNVVGYQQRDKRMAYGDSIGAYLSEVYNTSPKVKSAPVINKELVQNKQPDVQEFPTKIVTDTYQFPESQIFQQNQRIAPPVGREPVTPYYLRSHEDDTFQRLVNSIKIDVPNPMEMFQSIYGYNRGKSFPFNFWNRNHNVLKPVMRY